MKRTQLPSALLASVLAAAAACGTSSTDTVSRAGAGGGGGQADASIDGAGGTGGEAGGTDGGPIFDASTDGGPAFDTGPAAPVVVIDPSAPMGAPGMFGGSADPNAAPSVAYPADGIIIPPNLNTLEVQWTPSAGQTLFAVDFTSPSASFTVYTGCKPIGSGCGYDLGMEFWGSVADKSRGGVAVKWHVRGVDAAGKVGQSADRQVWFTNEDLLGGLYYWNTGGSIMRYDFGLPAAPPETYLAGNVIACQGCHSVSRDGKRSVAATGPIPGFGPWTVYDVATITPIQVNGKTVAGTGSNFFSLNSDGSKLVLDFGGGLALVDVTTGVQSPPFVSNGSMPDWAPDDRQITYATQKSPLPLSGPGVSTASIVVQDYDGTNLGSPNVVVPTDGVVNNYYPTFSPDGAWVAFNRSPGGHSSYANDAPDQETGALGDGQLWVVPAAGGTPIQLSAATGTDPCSWAKWTPSILTYQKGSVFFVTFTTEAQYGLRLSKGQTPQLWMAGFDPNVAGKGTDGSFPAIWLPFQDITSGNRIAQWVTKVQRHTCMSDSECPAGEKCENGTCLPQIH